MSLALVTGGTGIVGPYIVDSLLQQEEQVRLVTRRSIKPWHSNLEIIRGDLRDGKIIESSLSGVDSVYHCASELTNQEHIWETNVLVTERLLEALPPTVKYFCYMGSAGVLGTFKTEWADETTPCIPHNLYVKSKLEAEKIVLSSSLDANVCALRPVQMISPKHPGCVSFAVRNGWKDRLMVWVKGREHAHIIHAGDVAAAAIHFRNRDLPQPECFIVACDEDELNTVGGIYAYYNDTDAKNKEDAEIFLPASLPASIPHFIRAFRRGPSWHLGIRFSSRKLHEYGVQLPFGFRGAIDDIRSHWNSR